MKNIFILSNSFTARTILYQIDYLFNFKIGKIYILEENHDYLEIHNISDKVELVSSVDIDKFIKISDIVLIFQDTHMPYKLIKHIERIATEKNKIIIIDNPWTGGNLPENELNECIRYDDIPVILQIVFGEYTQHYCTEILLNQILSSENVPFIQEFSYETLLLIEQLSKHDVINKRIIQSAQSNLNNHSVVVKSIYVKQYKALSKDNKIIEMIEQLSPSYIVMNISSNCIVNDSMKNIFIYKYGKPLDVIVKSPYVEIDLTQSQCGTYCEVLDVDFHETYNPTSSYLEKQLKFELFAKISFPKEVTVL